MSRIGRVIVFINDVSPCRDARFCVSLNATVEYETQDFASLMVAIIGF